MTLYTRPEKLPGKMIFLEAKGLFTIPDDIPKDPEICTAVCRSL